MTAAELLDYFRSQVRDDVLPYLWSDEEIYVYMNDAQRMFVRLTGGIFDATTCKATEVDVIAGEKYSDLHPSILHIREAFYGPERRKIKLIDLGSSTRMTSADYGIIRSIGAIENPGRVEYMVIGEERNKCRWVSIPDEDATVYLAVARLPYKTLSDAQQQLEVSDEHHINLIEWMKHRAYNKHDGDVFNPTAAAESEQRFKEYCAFVWKEWERYRHVPRTVAYGGI